MKAVNTQLGAVISSCLEKCGWHHSPGITGKFSKNAAALVKGHGWHLAAAISLIALVLSFGHKNPERTSSPVFSPQAVDVCARNRDQNDTVCMLIHFDVDTCTFSDVKSPSK